MPEVAGGSFDAIGPFLVGIDGSPDSLSALRWASWLASATGQRLVLAYTWQHGRRLEGAFATPHGDASSLERDVVATLRRLASEELGSAADAVVDECVALRGLIATALGSEAAHRGAGLIVVGASGTGGARRPLLGSVSRALTECPAHAVAVVSRHDEEDRAGRPFLVGVDGSDGSARAVRWAAEAARAANAEVVAVDAYESPVPDPSPAEDLSLLDERRGRLEEEWCAPLRTAGVRYRTVVERGDARQVISRVAEETRPVCGVVGSRGLGVLSQRLLGSVTHHLVRELAWPVVVIPSSRDRVIWPPV